MPEASQRMHRIFLISSLVFATACVGREIEDIKVHDLEEAFEAFRTNIVAIQRRDVEGYLAHYLDSPELVIAAADSLRRGFFLFAEARRASDEWPDTLFTGEPQLVWVAPGVVWGAFEFTSVVGSDTTRGLSERLFLKTGGGWKIVVTGAMER